MIKYHFIIYLIIVTRLYSISSRYDNMDHMSTSNYHHCIHDDLEPSQLRYENLNNEHDFVDMITPRKPSFRNLQSSNWTRIRIITDYSGINLNMSTNKQNMIINLVNSTINYYESALKVLPLNEITFSATRCYNAFISEKYLNTSTKNADLILFVTSTLNNSDFIAWGIACAIDSSTNRPIAGQINFNERVLNESYQAWDQQIAITLHEVMHILGFSQSLFPYYIDSNGSLLDQVATIGYRNGVPGLQIIMPNIISAASSYFSCNSIKGVDLEQQWITGNSIGSHWERRIFGNELMTANYIDDMRLSRFSFLILEGTGWYQVDYNYTDRFDYGYGKGCSFIEGPCINSVNYTSNFPEFCTPFSTIGCSWDRSAISFCGYYQDTPVYSQWDYFNNGSVGSDPFSDNCPTSYPQPNGQCRFSWNAESNSNNFYDQYFGTGSKCFDGNFAKSNVTNSSMPNQIAGCFDYHCFQIPNSMDWELHVYIGQATAICTKTAGTEPIAGYNGVMNCPNANEFCGIQAQIYCDKGCMGRGSCINNICICNDGWKGDDCGIMTVTPGCSNCMGTPRTPDCFGDICICDINSHSFCPTLALNINPSVEDDEVESLSGYKIFNQILVAILLSIFTTLIL